MQDKTLIGQGRFCIKLIKRFGCLHVRTLNNTRSPTRAHPTHSPRRVVYLFIGNELFNKVFSYVRTKLVRLFKSVVFLALFHTIATLTCPKCDRGLHHVQTSDYTKLEQSFVCFLSSCIKVMNLLRAHCLKTRKYFVFSSLFCCCVDVSKN